MRRQPGNPPSCRGYLARFRHSAVIVGSVIGSGIFIVPAQVARDVPNISGIILVWVIGGMFSLAGAMTLAELGAMIPRAGTLRLPCAAYGALPAFLFGWTEFLIMRTGRWPPWPRRSPPTSPTSPPLRQHPRPNPASRRGGHRDRGRDDDQRVGHRDRRPGPGGRDGPEGRRPAHLDRAPLVLGGGKVANLTPLFPPAFNLSLLGG